MKQSMGRINSVGDLHGNRHQRSAWHEGTKGQRTTKLFNWMWRGGQNLLKMYSLFSTSDMQGNSLHFCKRNHWTTGCKGTNFVRLIHVAHDWHGRKGRRAAWKGWWWNIALLFRTGRTTLPGISWLYERSTNCCVALHASFGWRMSVGRVLNYWEVLPLDRNHEFAARCW